MTRRLVVVVPAELGVDVAHRLQSGRRVERAGREADRVPARCLPEEARSTLRAEAAAGVCLALRTVYPAQGAVVVDVDVLAWRLAFRPQVTGPAPALAAMAHDHVARRAVHLEADGPA